MKRRIIYMDEASWSTLKLTAEGRNETISGLLRQLWIKEVSGPTAAASSGRPEPIIAEGSLGAIAAVQRAAKERLGPPPVLFGRDPSFGTSRAAPKPASKRK